MAALRGREEREMQTDLFGAPTVEQPKKAQGRAAGVDRGKFAEAMRDARDIRKWTDGPNAPDWRIRRLAQALFDGR